MSGKTPDVTFVPERAPRHPGVPGSCRNTSKKSTSDAFVTCCLPTNEHLSFSVMADVIDPGRGNLEPGMTSYSSWPSSGSMSEKLRMDASIVAVSQIPACNNVTILFAFLLSVMKYFVQSHELQISFRSEIPAHQAAFPIT